MKPAQSLMARLCPHAIATARSNSAVPALSHTLVLYSVADTYTTSTSSSSSSSSSIRLQAHEHLMDNAVDSDCAGMCPGTTDTGTLARLPSWHSTSTTGNMFTTTEALPLHVHTLSCCGQVGRTGKTQPTLCRLGAHASINNTQLSMGCVDHGLGRVGSTTAQVLKI